MNTDRHFLKHGDALLQKMETTTIGARTFYRFTWNGGYKLVVDDKFSASDANMSADQIRELVEFARSRDDTETSVEVNVEGGVWWRILSIF